jgi:hypothetical protein
LLGYLRHSDASNFVNTILDSTLEAYAKTSDLSVYLQQSHLTEYNT